VLSPCRTFRPEQQAWKQLVHGCELGPAHDAAEAAELIQRDDGLGLGVLFEQKIPVYTAGVTADAADTLTTNERLAAIEAEHCR
jgi:2-oxoglutarate ferredoxin oxidoreductase subunit beta